MRSIFLATILSGAVALAQADSAEAQNGPQAAQARKLLREAGRLIKEIDKGKQPSLAANVAGQQARAGDLNAALATANTMTEPQDRALARGSIAWTLAHSGDVPGALRVLGEAKEESIRGGNYVSLAVARAEAGDYAGALRVAAKLKDFPVQWIDVRTRIAVERGSSGDIRGALTMLRETLDDVDQMPADSTLEVSQMLAGIALAQWEVGDRAAALATRQRLEWMALRSDSAIGNPFLLPALVEVQIGMDDIPSALESARRIEDQNNRESMLSLIAQRVAKAGEMPRALEIIAELRLPYFQPLCLRSIAMAQVESGDVQGAIETIQRIPEAGGRADVMATAALEFAEKENPAAAQLADLAQAMAGKPTDKNGTNGLKTIAVTRGILHDFPSALAILAELSDPEARVWPVWNLTMLMVEAGKTSEALELARDEEAALPKAYALLGTASGLLDQIEAERKKSLR